MSTNIVQIENLVKRYGNLVALDHLNLSISEGEVFGLLGPNGSGKLLLSIVCFLFSNTTKAAFIFSEKKCVLTITK